MLLIGELCYRFMINTRVQGLNLTMRCSRACSWTTNEIAESLQDLVICIEMLGCAVAHHYVFPIPSAIEYDQVRRGELESRYQNNEPLLNKVCWRGRDFLLSSIIADYTRFPVRV